MFFSTAKILSFLLLGTAGLAQAYLYDSDDFDARSVGGYGHAAAYEDLSARAAALDDVALELRDLLDDYLETRSALRARARSDAALRRRSGAADPLPDLEARAPKSDCATEKWFRAAQRYNTQCLTMLRARPTSDWEAARDVPKEEARLKNNVNGAEWYGAKCRKATPSKSYPKPKSAIPQIFGMPVGCMAVNVPQNHLDGSAFQ